ncbi:hypothetical protein [Thiocapsa marina]|uniref:Uncharacterized protein n=1 Tax=Thiocapsa marina 5811 TaxID=768671 RepID=F9UD05_9GAMM|nr:hypothetical protein [Thiocapsa marina]EGV17749.1 hypothetical protein ThimaDRAFT_2807 [Thiocapsa marina 5811]
MQQIERRVIALERRSIHVADGFVKHLNADDAKFNRRIARRHSASGLDFDLFVRIMPDDDVRRLHALHMGVLAKLGVSIDDLPNDDSP